MQLERCYQRQLKAVLQLRAPSEWTSPLPSCHETVGGEAVHIKNFEQTTAIPALIPAINLTNGTKLRLLLAKKPRKLFLLEHLWPQTAGGRFQAAYAPSSPRDGQHDSVQPIIRKKIGGEPPKTKQHLDAATSDPRQVGRFLFRMHDFSAREPSTVAALWRFLCDRLADILLRCNALHNTYALRFSIYRFWASS